MAGDGMIRIRNALAQAVAIRGIKVRGADGILRTIVSAYVRGADNVLRAIFTSGSVSVFPQYASGYANSKTAPRVVTSTVTLTISGVTTPYIVAWQVSDSSWQATNPSSASTAFRSPSLSGGEESDTTAFATVTDANGQVFTSDTVTITAQNIGA
jgi:hypothetical protein